MVEHIKELAEKIPTVTFLKVDVDELKSVATDWAVEAMPTFMFIKDGKIVDKVVGAKKYDLQQTIANHISSLSSSEKISKLLRDMTTSIG